MSRAGKANIGPEELERILELLQTTTLSYAAIGETVGRNVFTVYWINRRASIRTYLKSGDHVVFRLPDGTVKQSVVFSDFVYKLDRHWLWTGRMNGQYPRWHDEQSRYASHIVWEQERGPIPEGHFLVRTCDKTHCIAPAHHRVMTPAERRRTSRSTNLTWRDVNRIRRSKCLSRELAKDYGVSQRHINRIRQGVRWQE